MGLSIEDVMKLIHELPEGSLIEIELKNGNSYSHIGPHWLKASIRKESIYGTGVLVIHADNTDIPY